MGRSVWDEMRRMQKRMNRMFRGFDEDPWDIEEEDLSEYRKAWVDARESDDEYVIAVELPGVDKEDIKININDGVEIRVEKKKEDKKKSGESYSYEKSYIGFYRRIPLPENADGENMKAEYKNGILKLKIKKKDKVVKGREVRVD